MTITPNQEQRGGNIDFTRAPVVIIGAGVSGICTAIDLIKRSKCHNFVILEKSSSVGGTWNDNKYPGCSCDVRAALYSYSFEQRSDWSREYPGQQELWQYLVDVAQRYGLFQHIRFNSAVEEARWDNVELNWKVTVNVCGDKDSQFVDSYEMTTDFLVSAVGQLNVPRWPDISGLDDFQGKLMHSARWDWSYNINGKRIGVIGNGASAVQIIPEIAKSASHVTVYQRNPNWTVPRQDRPVSPIQRVLLSYLPPLRWRKRALMMDFHESIFHGAVTKSDSSSADIIRTLCRQSIAAQIPDKPELWEVLTPNYSPGCKRVIFSDSYYPTLNKRHVDLETRPIARVAESGIETADGELQEHDLIVVATGFRSVEFMHPIRVLGRNGRPLSDIWRNGAVAYYGMTVEDLPNFAMLYGPNTNLGHNSIILMIEAQSRYISAMISRVLFARQSGLSLSLRPNPDAVKKYDDHVQTALNSSSFADPKCSSWYKQADGRITNNWSEPVTQYQKELSRVRWNDYLAEGTGKALVENKKPTNIGRVREETLLDTTSLLIGTFGVLAALGGYYMRGAALLK